MDKNKNCSACNINEDKDNYKKVRDIWKNSYKRKKKRLLILSQRGPERKFQLPINKSMITKLLFQHLKATAIIGPSNVGKTFYMLKILERIDKKRPTHTITRSFIQHPNYKTSNNINSIDKNKESVVIFDGMVGARNSSQIDGFFIRQRHENLDVYYFSQSFFGLSRQSIRNNSDRLLLFKQALRDVETMYRDIEANDME